jgi:hypothetical protein
MAADVAATTKDCQRGKVTAQPAPAVEQILALSRRFSHIHMDLVGPLPSSAAGYSYIFTAVDRSSLPIEGPNSPPPSGTPCAAS